MKKLLTIGWFILGFIFITNISAQAQDSTNTAYPVFQEGDIVINAGIGLGATYSTYGGGLGLPIGGGVEYGVADLETGIIGVGGDVGFISGSGVTVLYIGAKGSYHFNELVELNNDKLDLYGGLGLYYRNYSSSNIGSGMVAAFHLGARYYFTEQLGAYAELGNNWGWLNLGIAFNL